MNDEREVAETIDEDAAPPVDTGAGRNEATRRAYLGGPTPTPVRVRSRAPPRRRMTSTP
ncbi:MAG: hypothetical protein AAGF11_41960 [Myxococcota bacterium]